MNSIAYAALIGWPVVSIVSFALLPKRWAVIVIFGGAWLLLPHRAAIAFQGLPEYTKFSAADIGALLGLLLFDLNRISQLRFRFVDLFALGWCLCPIPSILLSGLPVKNLISEVSDSVILWGIPYFFGRLYFTELGRMRDLAIGAVAIGLFTLPMVIIELVTNRALANVVYGLPIELSQPKWGLPGAKVFAMHQLELGMWATITASVAFWLWCTRSVDKILGLPIGLCVILCYGQAILCHQTGALALLVAATYYIGTAVGQERVGRWIEWTPLLPIPALMGLVGIRNSLKFAGLLVGYLFARRTRPQLIAWLLIAVTPVYIVGRSTGLMDGRTVGFVAGQLFGSAREKSLRFRFANENKLRDRALKRPIFGVGSYSGKFSEEGSLLEGIIVDGLWIIPLGKNGLFGLFMLYGLICFPQVVASRRYPVRRWSEPRVAPSAALMVGLALYSIDSVLNAATPNPLYLIIMGGFGGLSLRGVPGQLLSVSVASGRELETLTATDRDLSEVRSLFEAGRVNEAEGLCRRLVSVRSAAGPSKRLNAADAWICLAELLKATGRSGEAETARHQAMNIFELKLKQAPKDMMLLSKLAKNYERSARDFSSRGALSMAIDAWSRSLELRERLLENAPDDPELIAMHADALNNLAWLMISQHSDSSFEPRKAAALAEQATKLDPNRKAYWNTLAAAYYRLGEPEATLSALQRSRMLPGDGAEYDDVLAALAYSQIGDVEATRNVLIQLDSRLAAGASPTPSLLQLREEAVRTINTLNQSNAY